MKMRLSLFILLIIACSTVSPTDVFSNQGDKTKKDLSKTKKSGKKAEVDIDFCLLNKKGEQTNKIPAGENFLFSLSLQNNSGDSLFLDNSFLDATSGFCSVYSENNELVGQPFLYYGAEIVGSEAHPFFGKFNIFSLQIPWHDSRNNWSALHYNFKSSKQKELPKGKYYTEFKHRFCFDRKSGRPSFCMQPVTIRINFEVI